MNEKREKSREYNESVEGEIKSKDESECERESGGELLKPHSKIQHELFALRDSEYREFHARLMPNVDKEKIIGIRTPVLRAYAKSLYKENADEARLFMAELPHDFYEENNLHGALIGLSAGSVQEALEMIDALLPYVDNWATCDMLAPKIFNKDKALVRAKITEWLESKETYRVRFAIVTMLGYFLDEAFEEEDLRRLAEIKSEEYYINMAIAWYYSFALIKQYDRTVGLFEARTLDPWIQNKSIQKACESYRISPEIKEYLRTLKIKRV